MQYTRMTIVKVFRHSFQSVCRHRLQAGVLQALEQGPEFLSMKVSLTRYSLLWDPVADARVNFANGDRKAVSRLSVRRVGHKGA